MADGSHIEWTSATWSPITGCSVISPGCQRCYAMRLAGTRLKHHPSRAGLTQMTKTGPVWTGEVRFNEYWLEQPIRWTKSRNIFCVAHGDLFHKNVSFTAIDRVIAVMILTPHHNHQVLTKRPERMLEYFSGGRDLYKRVLNAARPLRAKYPRLGDIPIDDPGAGAWHPNILLGTSVEDQPRADERIAALHSISDLGWKTWVSYEPALELVNWRAWEFISWLVSGGESGPGYRPSDPDWHRTTRDWCKANGIRYFCKQMAGKKPIPEDLLIREMP